MNTVTETAPINEAGMRIIVFGGSGLIGTKVVKKLTERGHQVLAASPSTGVDATTGQGLDDALAGAEVVVDVMNSPSFEEAAVLAFFERSGGNLMRAEADAGVRHHVALSIVGIDRLQGNGYFRAKLAQERLIKAAGIHYTIVRATQFFEFLGAIAAASAAGDVVRLSGAALQPIAADDVAEAVVGAALAAPLNGTLEIAGPERLPLSEAVERYLSATGDTRRVAEDPTAPYFGAILDEDSLVPGDSPRLFSTRLDDWLTPSGK
jgi:uncharacterized protein YbjT (DUF2867 family)